jgi:rhamnose transport system permease protein
MSRILLPLGLIICLCLAIGAKEPRFFQPPSIDSILLWMPMILVAAMGQLSVILTRGIDISIGSILGFTGIGIGLLCKSHPSLPLPLIFLAGLGFGLALGFVNAALVVWGKLSPLIVTIGTLAAYRGLAFLLSGGDQIDRTMLPDSLTDLAKTGIGLSGVTVSWLLLIALGVAIATAVFLRWSQIGRNIYALGSNPEAAHLRGISSRTVNLVVFTLSGATAGLAAVMYAARFGFVNPGSAGQSFELTVIAAVAIGGAKLTGGSGSVLGVFLGCVLLSCINVGLATLGIDANWQMLTYGLVILVAIGIDGIANKSWKVRA